MSMTRVTEEEKKTMRNTLETLRRHIFNAGALERFVSEIKIREQGWVFLRGSAL